MILGTKWKRLDAEDVRNRNVSRSDVYQILAYAHAYDADRLILLYPWDSHLGEPGLLKEWNMVGTKRLLQAARVDVGRTHQVIHQLRLLFQKRS